VAATRLTQVSEPSGVGRFTLRRIAGNRPAVSGVWTRPS